MRRAALVRLGTITFERCQYGARPGQTESERPPASVARLKGHNLASLPRLIGYNGTRGLTMVLAIMIC